MLSFIFFMKRFPCKVEISCTPFNAVHAMIAKILFDQGAQFYFIDSVSTTLHPVRNLCASDAKPKAKKISLGNQEMFVCEIARDLPLFWLLMTVTG